MMSGRLTPQSGKTTTWASEWRVASAADFENSDSASQISDSTVDETSHAEVGELKQRLKKLFEDQIYTDVLFYPKDNTSSSISAHKAILAIGSPLFAKMLFGSKSEDTTTGKIKVQISNMSFAAFCSIVKYLYTDEVFFETDDLVQEILEGAKEFEIQSLVDQCKAYYESVKLTDRNVFSKLMISTSNKIEPLRDRCVEYIQQNTARVIRSQEFQNCSATIVRTICKLPSLNLRSEAELLEAVMSWLNSQPPVNKQQMVQPLLKCIRFLTLTANELTSVIRKFPDLFTADEGLQMMMYLNNPPRVPDFKSLPPWINKNAMRRCFFTRNQANLPFENIQLDDRLTRKVVFPLTESIASQYIPELTSMLQMKCIMGAHEIHAVKLSFQGPVSDSSVIRSLSIVLNRSPAVYRIRENIEIANSLNVRVPFKKIVRVRRGDILDIEVEAKHIEGYRFLQFDETCKAPKNPHFQCCVASQPRIGRFFFISEVEYGPQTLQGHKNFKIHKGFR